MKHLFILITTLVCLAACNSQRAIQRACAKCGKSSAVQASVDSFFLFDTIVLRDTTITTVRDESSITALLQCDSLGNVLLHVIDSVVNGKAKPAVTIKKNILTSRCVCDTTAIAFSWIEKHRQERSISKDSVVVIQPEYRDKPLGWWDNIKVRWGGYAFSLIAAVVGFYIIRFVLKTYLKIQLPWTSLS